MLEILIELQEFLLNKICVDLQDKGGTYDFRKRYDKIDKVRGMDIIFVTTAKTDEEARELLTQFNMPFAK